MVKTWAGKGAAYVCLTRNTNWCDHTAFAATYHEGDPAEAGLSAAPQPVDYRDIEQPA